MPPEFAGGEWERYEPESVAALSVWARCHPDGTVVDIGSSIGIFSAVALFSNIATHVVAIDSDLPSLAATRRMCQHAPGNRLQLVYGLVSDVPTVRMSLAAAASSTDEQILRAGVRGDSGTTRYVCLTDSGTAEIRRLCLDDMFSGAEAVTRPLLIKCDVEGAELLVLRGAAVLLRRARPELLLSVHPEALRENGHSKEDIVALLSVHGYAFKCLAVDHEEHWWCEPLPQSRAPGADAESVATR
jgi:FkbM family methyltransferase